MAKAESIRATYEQQLAAGTEERAIALRERDAALARMGDVSAAQKQQIETLTAQRDTLARESAEAAKSALKSVTEIEGYLQVRAPFDGVVTERNVHPGTLVGPASGSGNSLPLVRVETTARLRLVVPVPEKYVAGMAAGAQVEFSVPAYPNQTFSGTVARIAHSVETKTRTMPVELDVDNSRRRLAAGMFPEVLWPVHRSEPTHFVPTSAVARTTEATFLVRIRDGNAEWVNVQTGELDGKMIEVFGDLRDGDQVAVRGTDELRSGTHVVAKQNSSDSKSQGK